MGKKASKSPTYQAPALEKGLDIIELLAEHETGLTQLEIATHLDRSPSELFRMLDCLTKRGYLRRRSPEDRYRLTSKLFVLAHQYPPTHRLHETAMPVLRELAHEIEQSCHLGVPDEGHLLIMAQVDAPGFLSYTVRVGMRVPMIQTGSGMVLLAFQADARRDEWLDCPANRLGKAEFATIVRRMKQLRRRGYEKRASQLVGGVTDLSAPVLDHTNHAVAAITVPYLSQAQHSRPVEQVLEAVVEAANEMSNQLGATQATPG